MNYQFVQVIFQTHLQIRKNIIYNLKKNNINKLIQINVKVKFYIFQILNFLKNFVKKYGKCIKMVNFQNINSQVLQPKILDFYL